MRRLRVLARACTVVTGTHRNVHGAVAAMGSRRAGVGRCRAEPQYARARFLYPVDAVTPYPEPTMTQTTEARSVVRVSVRRAQDTPGTPPVPDLIISAQHPLPANDYDIGEPHGDWLARARVAYEADADLIADGLSASLPGGTLDALLRALLLRRALYWSVPATRAGGATGERETMRADNSDHALEAIADRDAARSWGNYLQRGLDVTRAENRELAKKVAELSATCDRVQKNADRFKAERDAYEKMLDGIDGALREAGFQGTRPEVVRELAKQRDEARAELAKLQKSVRELLDTQARLIEQSARLAPFYNAVTSIVDEVTMQRDKQGRST